MKFIITGGCGYIETNITKHLLEKGHRVTIDNLWFGNKLKNKNLKIIKKILEILTN